ncbi:MAG TPA: CAP domain-containing protein [Caulobacteraceae bacterium]|nr:CAP domain-containing protein [Caulobacteraceae bacterium]
MLRERTALARWSLAGALAALIAAPAHAAVDLDALDNAVAAELNFARMHPQAYAQTLAPYRREFHGKLVKAPGHATLIRTDEGVAAVDEAIAYLKKQAPLDALGPSAVLAGSAEDHVLDQGPSGQIGHTGTDGSILPERIDRRGQWVGLIAEDIGYGYATGREVVRQLIVDDGVADRGHRVNIFNRRLRLMGVACGPHQRYGLMCVIDFGSDVISK